jgi:hypothetical protein
MDNKGKKQLFTISDEINILQVDVYIGTHIELVSRGLYMSILNTVLKKLA